MKEVEPSPNTKIHQTDLIRDAQLSLTRSQRRREYLTEAKRRSRALIKLDPERYQQYLVAERERYRKNADRKRAWRQVNLETIRTRSRESMRRLKERRRAQQITNP